VASPDYFTRLKRPRRSLRLHDLSDECYSEIFTGSARQLLECAGPDFTKCRGVQSLSKRSNLPGMRVGRRRPQQVSSAMFHEDCGMSRAAGASAVCSMSRSRL